VCPMISPLRPLPIQLGQQFDFFWGHGFSFFGLPFLGFRGLHRPDLFLLFRLARNYCGLAGFVVVRGALLEEKAETAVSFHPTPPPDESTQPATRFLLATADLPYTACAPPDQRPSAGGSSHSCPDGPELLRACRTRWCPGRPA